MRRKTNVKGLFVKRTTNVKVFSLSVGLKIRVLFDNEAYASAIIPLKLWRDLPY
jgi:hypothetical protein